MQKTPIEWTDWSVNPFKMRMPDGTLINACIHKSDGCKNCYAEGIVRRYWHKEWGEFPGYTAALLKLGTPVLVEKELEAVLRLSERIAKGKADPNENKIFWNDMTDEFLDFWPDEFLDKVQAVRALTPNLIHQVLTKRPERMRAYMLEVCSDVEASNRIRRAINDIPSALGDRRGALELPLFNVWLGTSIEDQRTADQRIPLLLETAAAVRWISAEPLLGAINLHKVRDPNNANLTFDSLSRKGGIAFKSGLGLDQVIVGGESGPGARPFDLAWARNIVAQCKTAGVACFVKQLGAKPIDSALDPRPVKALPRYEGGHMEHMLIDRKGGDPSEWPEDLRVREFPTAQEVTE